MWKNELNKRFTEIFKNFIKEKYGVLLNIFEEEPPALKYGEVAFSFPLKLSKELKRKPYELAKEIEENLREKFYPHKLVSFPPGYLNIFYERNFYINEGKKFIYEKEPKREKILIEHTNINPNKAAHIGHLRNAILGDVLANLFKYMNYNVEVHNYIDNTGVQVADVVLGLIYLEKKDLNFLEEIEKLDYYTWDLYSKVSKEIEEKKEFLALRNEILKKIEEDIEPEATYAKLLSNKILECHLKTMWRLNITYDLLPKESEILKSELWKETFEILKSKKVILYEKEGQRAGCWVLPLRDKENFSDLQEPEKILVRSNGTVTYTGKDIAYQLWKFGILKERFCFKPFYKYENGKVVWETTMEKGEVVSPPFGKGDIVINVIDVRQAYLQKIVKEALKLLGYEKEANNSIHFSYEMVMLSEKEAQKIGERKKIKISGRKGVGIKADDFIDELIRRAKEEILKRNIDLNENEVEKLSKEIAQGALKVYFLKFGKEKVINFDFEEALNFDGDTGPYLQYALVRINSLIKKLKKEGKEIKVKMPIENMPDDLWEYLMHLENFDYKIEKAIKNLDPSILVHYLIEIAKNFHNFYHNHPFLKEENFEIYNKRLFLLYKFQEKLKKGFEILNIPIPEKM